MIILPPYLKPKDKVAIVSSAGKISLEKIQPAIKTIESWGLEVVVTPNVGNNYHRFGATDAQRLHDLQWAFDAQEIKAVFAARGGYGIIRIIDQLNLRKFTQHPKWVVGYSDVTVLHSYLHQKTHIPTLHAELCTNFPADLQPNLATKSLKNALFGDMQIQNPTPHPQNRFGRAHGVLVGGNLSILYSLLGSKDFETKNKILFIEDISEQYYHIDRMMHSLKRAGKLKNLAGLVVGSFWNMQNPPDNLFGSSLSEIIFDAVKNEGYPVVFGFEAGHVLQNQALVLGAPYRLQVAEEFVSFSPTF